MIRSLPSIFVLALMCCTITYGLVQFPEVGTFPGTQIADKTDRSVIVNTNCKPAIDVNGNPEPLQVESATPESTVKSVETKELFQSAADEKESAENPSPSDSRNSGEVDSASVAPSLPTAEELENNVESALPTIKFDDSPKSDTPSNESAENPTKQTDELLPIPLPDESELITGADNLPIEDDQSLPSDLEPESIVKSAPTIVVGAGDSAPENPNPPSASSTSTEKPTDVTEKEKSSDSLQAAAEKSVDDVWNDLFADNNSESSSESGKAESETQDQTPTPESADLQPLPELGESSPGDSKAESNTEPDSSNGSENAVANPAPQPDKRAIDASDPYAQSIPPSTPNKKEVIPAATTDIQADKPVTDATYYQPVIGEQPPLPLEIIPLDDSAPVTHSVNYSPADDKPYDSLGINIPYGEIKVTRFPRIDNTTEPKYTASLF